jgi:AmmeMemoRadiSam system protein A
MVPLLSSKETKVPADEHGERLLRLSRESIAHVLGGPPPEEPVGAWFDQPGATFVTLTKRGHLHGCIGSIQIKRSIAADVRYNAVAAALRDPRSVPLCKEDLADLRIEISLLSTLEPVLFASEKEAIARIRPYVDGVVLAAGQFRGTFLPQVWNTIPSPTEFFAELKMKAGLPKEAWPASVELFRFTILAKWIDPGDA